MAVTANMYRQALVTLGNKEIALPSDTCKCSLHTAAGYTPNQDTDKYHSTPAGELAASGNYATGGATISPLTIATSVTKEYDADAADAVWANLTMSAAARYGVAYDATPATEATRPLLVLVNFGADQTVAGATFTIQWAAPTPGGLLSQTVA